MVAVLGLFNILLACTVSGLFIIALSVFLCKTNSRNISLRFLYQIHRHWSAPCLASPYFPHLLQRWCWFDHNNYYDNSRLLSSQCRLFSDSYFGTRPQMRRTRRRQTTTNTNTNNTTKTTLQLGTLRRQIPVRGPVEPPRWYLWWYGRRSARRYHKLSSIGSDSDSGLGRLRSIPATRDHYLRRVGPFGEFGPTRGGFVRS